MAKLKTVEELFKGRHFDRDVVILCNQIERKTIPNYCKLFNEFSR